MEVYKVRQLAGLAAGLLLILLLVSYFLHNRTSNPLAPQSYTNTISGTSYTFYAKKGLEVQSTGPVFINSDALNVLGSSRASDTLAALKQFVNAQSDQQSRAPVITNLGRSGSGYTFTLFIETNEQLYDVDLQFDSQQIPHLTYTVDTHATI